MSTLIIVACLILGFALAGYAVVCLHDPTIGPAVAVLGMLLAIVPLLVGRGMSLDAVQERTLESLQDRYGITIDEHVLSETPSRWRIDGDWYSCYVVDLDAPTTELDLRCSAYDAFSAPTTGSSPAPTK